MKGSGEIIVDEKLKAIDKRTGRYINVIARTIDNGTSFPIVKYLDKNRKELNYDCVRHLNFDIDIDWELRRYQIVKDLLSNDFDGRRLSVDEVDNAIFTADLIINKLKLFKMVRIDFSRRKTLSTAITCDILSPTRYRNMRVRSR